MKIATILILFTLSALSTIAQGNMLAAARNLYQPVLLSFGAAFSFMASDKVDADSSRWSEWMANTFSKSETQLRQTVFLNEDATVVDAEATIEKTQKDPKKVIKMGEGVSDTTKAKEMTETEIPAGKMTESEVEAKAKEMIDNTRKPKEMTESEKHEAPAKEMSEEEIEAKAKEMGYHTHRGNQKREDKIIGEHQVIRDTELDGEPRPKGWEQGDKEKTLAKEIKEKVAAAPDDKMPTKKYKQYVEDSIDVLKLEELEMMKKGLQDMGIIEKVNMGMIRGDVEA